ncbi:MAG: hypothetical protein LBP59_02525 [Planctomycetaceae bacterium]|jgi:hypothetical protein|nr:hypothetical protein [Planctomycetaceae bacterium]
MRKIIFVFLLLSIFVGCNNNNPQGRIPISGEVILDGKPLEQGDVLFLSTPGSSPVVTTGSPIKNGTFSLTAEQGLIPNQEYQVQFHSIEEIPGTRKEGNNPMELSVETRDIIPPQYGTESKEIIIVTKNKNKLRFDLKSKPQE